MIDPQDQQAYLALRAANDRLREEGCAWIWNVLEQLVAPPSSLTVAKLQLVRQTRQLQV